MTTAFCGQRTFHESGQPSGPFEEPQRRRLPILFINERPPSPRTPPYEHEQATIPSASAEAQEAVAAAIGERPLSSDSRGRCFRVISTAAPQTGPQDRRRVRFERCPALCPFRNIPCGRAALSVRHLVAFATLGNHRGLRPCLCSVEGHWSAMHLFSCAPVLLYVLVLPQVLLYSCTPSYSRTVVLSLGPAPVWLPRVGSEDSDLNILHCIHGWEYANTGARDAMYGYINERGRVFAVVWFFSACLLSSPTSSLFLLT